MKYYYTCSCVFERAHLRKICPICQSENPRVVRIDQICKTCGKMFIIQKESTGQLRLGTSKKRCSECLPGRLKQLNRDNKKQESTRNKKGIPKVKMKKHRWCTCCLKKGIKVPVAPGNYFLCYRCHKHPPEDEFELPSSNATHKTANEKYGYMISRS